MTEAGPIDRRRIIYRALTYGVLILAALYFLIPLWIMLTTSFKTLDEIRNSSLLAWPQTFTLEAWHYAWSQAQIGAGRANGLVGYFWNSVRMVVPAVVLSTALGAIAGYALTKWRFRGANLIFGMLLLGAFVPYQVFLLPMSQVLGQLGLANSIVGLVLVHTVYGIAFTTLFFRNFYVNVPDELVNAARIDGAGFFRIFWRIILPISGPIITVTVIWQFTQIWNDFLFGLVFSGFDSQPITVALNNLVNTSTGVKRYNVDMAAAMIAALPTLIVYVLAGKYFVRGLTAGSVKG
ncbi:MAG: carbohydrate ABC transporter permease [Candidatus Competibacterales bacterium]|nr:carbohydrate ABC transporter permease [Candidatus Competibacterales bacterium]